jgi:hypothetical protein
MHPAAADRSAKAASIAPNKKGNMKITGTATVLIALLIAVIRIAFASWKHDKDERDLADYQLKLEQETNRLAQEWLSEAERAGR